MRESPEGPIEIASAQAVSSHIIGKAFRYITPIFLGVISWLGSLAFGDIRAAQETAVKQQAIQTEQLSSLSTELKLLNAKVDYSVLQQVDSLSKRIDKLEQKQRE